MLYHEKQVYGSVTASGLGASCVQHPCTRCYIKPHQVPSAGHESHSADYLQVAALCGVHCINSLLQGPYFSEVDLAQVISNDVATHLVCLAPNPITAQPCLPLA